MIVFGFFLALTTAFVDDEAMCAAECLYVAALADKETSYKSFGEFVQKIGPPASKSGYSINEVQQIATKLGYVAQAQRLEPEDLKHALKEHRVILFLDRGHYVMARSAVLQGTHVEVFDPSRKERLLDLTSTDHGWDGSCVIIGDTPFHLPSRFEIPWLIASVLLCGVGVLILFRRKLVAVVAPRFGALLLGFTCLLGCSKDVSEGDSITDAVRADQGSVVLEKIDQSLGVLDQSENPALVEFQFQNRTNHDVEFDSVSVSCSCTKAVVEPKTVTSMQFGKIRVNLDRSKVGSFSATVSAFFKNAPLPPIVVKATWDVAGPNGELSISPNEFPMMFVVAGDGNEAFVELKNKNLLLTEDPQVNVVSSNDLLLCQARFEKHRFYLSVATDSQLQPGFYFGTVKVNANQSEMEIPWKLEVASPFSVLPKQVTVTNTREVVQLFIDIPESNRDTDVLLRAVDATGVSHELEILDVTQVSSSERVLEASIDHDWNSEAIIISLSNGKKIGEVKVDNATQIDKH